jgi:hypothetical protein
MKRGKGFIELGERLKAAAARIRGSRAVADVEASPPVPWPVFRRRSASTRGRYRRAGLCDECGGGAKRKGKALEIRPHEIGCPRLRQIIEIEASDVCSQCGAKKSREKTFDPRVQMVVSYVECPKGCSRTTSWTEPTRADIKELGLVRRKSSRKAKGPK